MKKTYSESELKENQVKAAFKQYPDAKKVFATTDGNVFLNENRANLHAGAKGTVFTFEKAAKQDTNKQLNATDTISAIDACETLEALKAFEGDERKTVIEAYNKKREALAEALKVVGAENVTK